MIEKESLRNNNSKGKKMIVEIIANEFSNSHFKTEQ
jgi:hypothetical protein